MKPSFYKSHTDRWFSGKKVVTTTVIENLVLSIPKGAILTIMRKSNGFTLITEPCPKCGVKVFIRGVMPSHIDLLPGEEKGGFG